MNVMRRVLAILCFIGIAMVTQKEMPVYADTVKLENINAWYEGDSVLVGETIDESKVKVEAVYSDGTSEIVTDYRLTSKTVSTVGSNTFVVIYNQKSTTFYVVGKRVTKIDAYYYGLSVSIGNKADPRETKVYATYSDNSQEEIIDFRLYNDQITKLGENKVTAVFHNVTTTFTVYGVEPKAVEALYATYSGGEIAVGDSINPRELSVIAVYKDGSNETINNYTLSPEKITAIGPQNVIAAFRGKTVTFSVSGMSKSIVGIKATYKGSAVPVGGSVRSSDIEVIATYNDGTSGTITNFNIMTPAITYVGYHLVTVEAGGYKAEFVVQGVEEQSIDYSNSSTFKATNGKHTATVALALYNNVDKSKITGNSVTPSEVRNVLRRSAKYNYYIAFKIELIDENLDKEFPMTMKITIPAEYKASGCSVYYTPNKKSVIGKMDVVVTGTNEITCTIHYPGTYILAYLR